MSGNNHLHPEIYLANKSAARCDSSFSVFLSVLPGVCRGLATARRGDTEGVGPTVQLCH